MTSYRYFTLKLKYSLPDTSKGLNLYVYLEVPEQVKGERANMFFARTENQEKHHLIIGVKLKQDFEIQLTLFGQYMYQLKNKFTKRRLATYEYLVRLG